MTEAISQKNDYFKFIVYTYLKSCMRMFIYILLLCNTWSSKVSSPTFQSYVDYGRPLIWRSKEEIATSWQFSVNSYLRSLAMNTLDITSARLSAEDVCLEGERTK